MVSYRIRILFVTLIGYGSGILEQPASAKDVQIDDRTYTLPDDWEWERVAGPPLVDRPICADFDEAGNLYVAESSGSNDKVEQQLEQRPHKLLRLSDQDHDGKFDTKTLFAEHLMLPEGTLWHGGSLYVAAPPSIWKFTDLDHDGVADKREEWFTATLTGCANDLHGPYLGRDGWIYWCKGAFAEQTHLLATGKTLTTRAAHIFRRALTGGPIEPVMTGGMDNPVEVAFSPSGERFFTTTFLQHPAHGLRDGVIHAIYGGVYGKVHGVIDEHPRTGDVLPPLVHLGAAAPCGLAWLESSHGGDSFRDSLVVTQFNRQRVTRHQLVPHGATFTTLDHDLVVTQDRDFHPTDVLEDADGSLLVIDTGGWYKLCCPTSNLWKPEVLGGIYRLRRPSAPVIEDARGTRLPWTNTTTSELAARLADSRPWVVRRSLYELSLRGDSAAQALRSQYQMLSNSQARSACVWGLTRLAGEPAREGVRMALHDSDPAVVQAALHSIALHRDHHAFDAVVGILKKGPPPHQRLAAEVLGRLENSAAVPPLVDQLAKTDDRILRHAMIHALLDLDRSALESAFPTAPPQAQAGLLIALDQARLQPSQLNAPPIKSLTSDWILPHLDAKDESLRQSAWWLLDRHEEWQADAAREISLAMEQTPPTGGEMAWPAELTTERLARLSQHEPLQSVLGRWLNNQQYERYHLQIMQAVQTTEKASIPETWITGLAQSLQSLDVVLADGALRAMQRLAQGDVPDTWQTALHQLVERQEADPAARMEALNMLSPDHAPIPESRFQLIISQLAPDATSRARQMAVSLLQRVTLSDDQLHKLATTVSTATLLDLRELLPIFVAANDAVRGTFAASLVANRAAKGLRLDEITGVLPQSISSDVAMWLSEIQSQQLLVRERIDRVASMVQQADPREGQKIYFSPQAACASCHALGYLGGRIGPDLSRIGEIRKERDLLESILLPSQSFVRSFEPLTVVMENGQTYNGVVQDETREQLTLVIDANHQIRLPQAEVLERHPGTVSIMPAGLAQQWTDEQLAQLARFLQTAR